MRMSKKLLSIILSFAIVVTSLVGFTTVSYAATKSFTSGDLSCTLDTDTGVFTVRGSGRGATYANSTTKRAPWYTTYRSQIKSVVIESGVIEIGAYWFYNCTNLASVTFADSVDTIGDCCFRSCTSLTNITLPRGCSWYYKELFLDCTKLKWAIMPDNNYTSNYSGKLPDGTFSGCTALEEVYIGSGHTSLDTKAFYNCRNLKGVIWDSGTISNVGTNALYNVSSSCTFFSQNNALSSWASNNSKSSAGLNASCSNGSLSYSFDTSNRAFRLNFSGNGNMTSTPWNNFHYIIKDVNFENVNNSYTISDSAFNGCENLNSVVFNRSNNGTLTIGNSAFYNCTSSVYWINIPENCTSIGTNAFNNTGFNWITIASPKISLGTNAFGQTGWAQFCGLHDSGVSDFVKAGKSRGYNWRFLCYVQADGSVTDANKIHSYNEVVTQPTCTDGGYTTYSCVYCDVDTTVANYTSPLGHKYSKCIGTNAAGTDFLYSCARCGNNSLSVNAIVLESLFPEAISHDNDNSPYNQSNYNTEFDVQYDGYVNAKDFQIITAALKKFNLTNKKTVINTNTTYQTMEGFGASGAWWAQDIGRWSDEQIDAVTELLYGDTGAGLNIYRYNLGGGSEDDTHIGDWRRRAEDFLSPSSNINNASTYDWNADQAARKVLASVKRANKDFKVTLFSNSAPVSITDNGRAYCSNGASQNLSESNYQSFANYVVNCAEHFIDEGYNVTDVSPINEPEWAWAADGNGNCSQEGCHFTAAAARTFYNNYMVPALQKSSKLNGKVGLSIWECAQLNHSDSNNYKTFLPYMFSSNTSFSSSSNYAAYNGNIRSYADSFDTHSYWASTSDRNTVASNISASQYSAIKKVRCTEYCQMTNDGNNNVLGHIQAEGGNTNGMTIAYGLALADIMYQDFTILNACEWDWWTACSGGIYPDGLVYVDYNNPDNIQTSKRLWAMGNYARFIEDGAKRVQVTTGSQFASGIKTNSENIYSWADEWGNSGTDKNTYIEQTAYLNPDGSVVVVYINNSDTDVYTGFDGYSTLETYVTDKDRDLELYQSGNAVNRVVQIPAMSITTVVLEK